MLNKTNKFKNSSKKKDFLYIDKKFIKSCGLNEHFLKRNINFLSNNLSKN